MYMIAYYQCCLFTYIYFHVFTCMIVIDWVYPPVVVCLIHHLLQRCGRETKPVLDGIANRECISIPDSDGTAN